MKKTSLLLIVTFLCALPIAHTAQVEVWHELRDNAPSAVNAEGVLSAEPEEVWEALIRFNDYSTFMPRVRESFFISPEGVTALQQAKTKNPNKIKNIAEQYKTKATRHKGKVWTGDIFMVVNAPFPVVNRWYVLHMRLDETGSAQRSFQRCWHLMVGNIDQAQGCWDLKPTAKGVKTFARYQDSIDPGGAVPKWASRMGATQTVPKIFKNLEKEVLRIRETP
jgi:ribosome-associated toxin RatA of RatAB toxin-antitoxin module